MCEGTLGFHTFASPMQILLIFPSLLHSFLLFLIVHVNIRCKILHAKLASAVAMALLNLYWLSFSPVVRVLKAMCVGVLVYWCIGVLK